MKGGCGKEEALIECSRRGSREAYGAIVEMYMKDAYFIALGLVGNREDALDLSQEAFFRAYNNIATLNSSWGVLSVVLPDTAEPVFQSPSQTPCPSGTFSGGAHRCRSGGYCG